MDWLHPRQFSRSEHAWIALFFLAAAILTTAPYCYFYAATPPEAHYTWASVFHYDDYFQYYAWANHIARGDWLIRNYYTGASEAGFGLFNPYFLVLGWFTRLTGNVYFATHALRIAGIAAFAWISYAFISLFLSEPRLRRLAQLLMLGGGLEFPFFLLSASQRPASPLADPYVYKVLHRTGHLTAALCLVLMIFGCFLAAHGIGEKGKRRWLSLAWLFALTLILGLINPYYVVLVACVLGADTARRAVKRDFSSFPQIAAVGFGGAAAYAHYRIQSLSSNLSTIAFDDPIGMLDFLLFFTILFPLAIAGFLFAFRTRSSALKHWPFLLGWMVAVIVLIFTPLEFRARMVFGLAIALAVPAAWLLGQRSLLAPYAWPIYALLLVDVYYTFQTERLTFHHERVGQIDRAMLAAFDELDRLAEPGDLVLSHGDTGNFIPAYTEAHVYIGHSFQRENYYEKAAEFDQFLTSMNEAQRAEFLDQIGADFLLIGPNEREIAPEFNFAAWPIEYENSGIAIYRRPGS